LQEVLITLGELVSRNLYLKLTPAITSAECESVIRMGVKMGPKS